MTPAKVTFISRDCFLELMKEHKEISCTVVQLLSDAYYPVLETARTLGLTTHPLERLAKLLLCRSKLAEPYGHFHTVTNIISPLTHQDIADSIGSTRETVSRLLCELRKKRLLSSKRSTISLDRLGLERLVHF
jgi:CRP-like cAMP-binding protein